MDAAWLEYAEVDGRNSGIHLICRFKDGKFRTKASIGFIRFRGDLDLFPNFDFWKTTWNNW